MKKRTKIMLIAMLILYILIFAFYIGIKFDAYMFRIVEVKNENAYARDKNNELYEFDISDPIVIKDWKKVEGSELKKNDIIFLLDEPSMVSSMEAWVIGGETLNEIHNARLVIVLSEMTE